ncbi:15128_t:CDS:2 [Acaulospora morrowiae]|uniref:15128_t:CDS:1 n=1 Tax=Acaulospora morrowiae TaxID=94023 RepID=A0A9N9GYH2_9GLOM|nr:15128_t:CDS:2 [Acaulospora morrowiae]
MTYIESKCFGNSHADDTNSGDAKKSPDISNNNNLPEEERKEITRALINVNKNDIIEVIINSIDQFNKTRMSTKQKSQQIYEKLIYIDFSNQDKSRWAPEWDKLCKMYKGLMINSTSATTTLPTYYRNHVKKTLPILKSNKVSAAKKIFLIEKIKNSIKDHQEKVKKSLLDFDQYKQDVVKFRQDIVEFKEEVTGTIHQKEVILHSCSIMQICMSVFNFLNAQNEICSDTKETFTMTREYVGKASEMVKEFSGSIEKFSGINNVHYKVLSVINSDLESFLSTKTTLINDRNKREKLSVKNFYSV